MRAIFCLLYRNAEKYFERLCIVEIETFCFLVAIIPQAGAGYNHLISNKREWANCFIKNAPQLQKTKIEIKTPQKITPTLTIFAEHGMMAHIP